MNEYLKLLIWAVVVLAIFGFMWSKGHLAKISLYVAETKEELRKCTWPSVEELKGSTLVVMITIALLGAFTVAVDKALSLAIWVMTS